MSASPRASSAAACLLIIVAGVLAYSNSFAGVFVFDDEPAIARNTNLGSLWPLSRAMTAPRDTTLAGRPFATLTFALDHAISGGSLEAYHRTNLAIHLAASLLVFGVLRRTLRRPAVGQPCRVHATGVAFSVAILFVVHPLQTGSVTYVVQRVESLMGLLYLATLYFSIRALDERSRRPRVWAMGAIVACLVGMATKEVMVTAPVSVLLWDRQFSSAANRPRRLLYAGLVSTWLVLAFLVVGGYRSASVGFGFEGWPWRRYLMTQAGVVAHYLRLSVFPSPLVLDYDWRPVSSVQDIATIGALIAGLVAVTTLGVIRRKPMSFAFAWFFLILAPTSSVLPIVTEVAAEHRMYLPLAGVLAWIVIGGFVMAQTLSQHLPESARRIPTRVAFVVMLALAAVFGRLTYARNADYQDFDRIWSDTIAKRPENARARNNYASSLLTQGRFGEAERHLRVAVREKPEDPEALANLGVALSAQGTLEEGAAYLRRAVALKPDFAEAHRNLGESLAMQHRLGDALAAYLAALNSLPDDLRLLNRASWILATASDPLARDGHRARLLAERAVRLSDGRDAASLDSLGAAFAELGDFSEATAAVERAILAARAAGDEAAVPDLQSRAAQYAQGRKIRVP